MLSFLMQPYPFNDNSRRKLAVCGGIGLFIAFFLRVFQPFGFDQLAPATKSVHALAFGAVTFFVSATLQITLPRVLPSFFREESWRSWKEITYLLLTTVLIGSANYALLLLLYPSNTSVSGFLRAQVMTLQIGLFPVVFLVFFKQMTLYRRFAAEAKNASAEMRPPSAELNPAVAQPYVSRLTIKGENQKEELQLPPEDLLWLSSADNYIKVQFRESGQVKQVIFRGSLKKMEEQLVDYPQFFRCHRTYLVNLHQVQSVSGNAQGLKLHLASVEEAVPVSRNLTETVREKLHGLSHSPQKA